MPKGSWREFDNSLETFEDDSLFKNQSKNDRMVRVQCTRSGRGGKTVTLISGLGLDTLEAKKLLKKLKSKCSTGGTVKEECIELQGNHVKVSIELLRAEGFCPKQKGG